MIAQAALLAALVTPTGVEDTKPFELMVGDPAPAIAVADWIQGEPVTAFEAGQTYVVEFWATWCGPCIQIIPHMNALHLEYDGKVQFMGISVWERLDKLEPGEAHPAPAFLKGMGDKMTYRVALDRKLDSDPKRMATSWMTAAGRRGIPAAFIVNSEGKIAWIGHPGTIDEPLAKIAGGDWDLAAEAKAYAAKVRIEARSAKIRGEVRKAMKAEDLAGALATIDAGIKSYPSLETSFGNQRYTILTGLKRTEEAAKYGRHLVANVIGDSPGALNGLAWNLIAPGTVTDTTDVGLALLAGKRACELTEWTDASILDTYAVALWADGKKEHAIDIQEMAVAHAEGRSKDELAKRLQEFKESISE